MASNFSLAPFHKFKTLLSHKFSPFTDLTVIDNIFIDVSQFENYTVTPIINGMSDRDAQLLMISTDYSHVPLRKLKTTRKINEHIISDFLNK
jgi:hypothetical protein